MRRMVVKIDDWIWPAILGSDRPDMRPVVGLPADARCVGVYKELNHLILSFESALFAEVEPGALYPELTIMFMAVDPSPVWVDAMTEALAVAYVTEAAEARADMGKPTERADAPDKPDAGGPRPAERADAPDRPGPRSIPTVPPHPAQPAKPTQPDT